jgi:hypothetical protein
VLGTNSFFVIPLGSVLSRDGIKVLFGDLGYQGKFDESGLDIFNLLLRFQIE